MVAVLQAAERSMEQWVELLVVWAVEVGPAARNTQLPHQCCYLVSAVAVLEPWPFLLQALSAVAARNQIADLQKHQTSRARLGVSKARVLQDCCLWTSGRGPDANMVHHQKAQRIRMWRLLLFALLISLGLPLQQCHFHFHHLTNVFFGADLPPPRGRG